MACAVQAAAAMQAASRRLLARGRVKMMKRQIKAATSMQQLWRAWASWNRVLEFRLLVAGAKKLSQARVRDDAEQKDRLLN